MKDVRAGVLKETLEYIRRVLERNEHRTISLEEIMERLSQEFSEFKREPTALNRDFHQRISTLEAA